MQTRMLIADDDADIRLMAAMLFQGPAWDVTLAASGTEAIEHVDAGDYDILVLDISMPGADGIAVAHAARRSGYVGAIVLWSGWLRSIDPDRLVSLGARRVEKLDVRDLQRELESLVA